MATYTPTLPGTSGTAFRATGTPQRLLPAILRPYASRIGCITDERNIPPNPRGFDMGGGGVHIVLVDDWFIARETHVQHCVEGSPFNCFGDGSIFGVSWESCMPALRDTSTQDDLRRLIQRTGGDWTRFYRHLRRCRNDFNDSCKVSRDWCETQMRIATRKDTP